MVHAKGLSVVKDIGTVWRLNERRLRHIFLIILYGGFAVLQAPALNGLSFDPFSFWRDGLAPPETEIGGREAAQALVMGAVIVVLEESPDLSLKAVRQIAVLQQDPALQGLIIVGNERRNCHARNYYVEP